jgi:uncharacterized membrane protein YphA (DoxX/SURF4 family)
MKIKICIKWILRIILGSLFVTTAALKVISVDAFEVYIYSFGFFNFLLSTLLARLLIAFEFIVGIGLIFQIQYKYVKWLTLLSLIVFTLFLIYVAIFRNDANCHCFGEFIQLDPFHSIFKNLIMTGILMYIWKEDRDLIKPLVKKIIAWGATAVIIIVCLVVIAPDSLYNKVYHADRDYNEETFEILKTDSTMLALNIDSGNYVIPVIAYGCNYCKMGMRKLNSIVEHHNLDTSKIKIYIAVTSLEQIETFKRETGINNSYHFYPISFIVAINIVHGKFPSFLYLSNGKIVRCTDMRGLTENELREWLIR